MHAWRDAPLHPELRITSTLGPPPREDKAKRKGRKASGAVEHRTILAAAHASAAHASAAHA